MEECQNCKWSAREDYYKYKDKTLCFGCLLDELEKDGKISKEITVSYYIEDEYIGNNDYDDYMVEKRLLSHYVDEIKVIKG